MARGKFFIGFSMVLFAMLAMSLGCGVKTALRTVGKPSDSKRQYLGFKKVAILPVNNIAGDKGAEDKTMGILVAEMNMRNLFEEVEDPRYVANVMKALKLRQVTELDKETVQKMGTEMSAQVLLLTDIHAWGLGQGADAAMNVSLVLTLMDTNTGKPIWVGTGSRRESFSWARAFGLNEGPTDLEVGRVVIARMIKELADEIQNRREEELVRIKAEEDAKLKAAAEAEKRRLEELMKEENQTPGQ